MNNLILEAEIPPQRKFLERIIQAGLFSHNHYVWECSSFVMILRNAYLNFCFVFWVHTPVFFTLQHACSLPLSHQESPLMHFSSLQFRCVGLFATPWIAPHQASLSITNCWSSLKLMSIESVMPSSHLIFCRPLLLLPPVPPSMSFFHWVNSLHEVAKVLEFQL